MDNVESNIIDGINELAEIIDEWESLSKLNIEKKLDILSGYFTNIDLLHDNRHKYFKFRQSLLSKQYDYQTTSNKISKIFNEYTDYRKVKLKNLLSSDDKSIKPSNQKQRDDYVTMGTNNITYYINQIDHIIGYIIGTIKNVDHMMYSIDSIIKHNEKYS